MAKDGEGGAEPRPLSPVSASQRGCVVIFFWHIEFYIILFSFSPFLSFFSFSLFKKVGSIVERN